MILSTVRRCNVDIMMLHISAMDHARKLQFSSYVHLPPVNKIFPYRYTPVILRGVGEAIILEHGCYIFQLWNILGC